MSTAHSHSNGTKTHYHIPALFLCMCTAAPALAIAESPAMDNSITASAAEKPMMNDTPPVASSAVESAVDDNRGRVARAIFTTAIADREPVDNLETLTNDTQRVYFFSDLRGLAGQIVTHRWEFNDEVMAEVTFKVGNGARWRVYSSKNLLPEWVGQWTVVVNDENGAALENRSFEYTTAMTTETPTAATP